MLPLPYASHCRITFEEPDWERFVPRYYQINYRTYARGPASKVRGIGHGTAPFTAGALSAKLLRPQAYEGGEQHRVRMRLAPGEKQTLSLDGEDRAIYTLRFEVADREREAITHG